MKMKDKLEKFGHKRGYYLARKTFGGFIVSLCVFSVVAIPTYIVSHTSNSVSKAQAIENEEDNDTEFQSVNDDK